jgi:hypothetical protein
MAKHVVIPMGFEKMGFHSSIDISGYARVLPEAAKKLPSYQWTNLPGFEVRAYDDVLSDIRGLKVKAGTSGTIEIELFVEYEIFVECHSWAQVGIGPLSVDLGCGKMPDKNDGTVSCGCTWPYDCSKAGDLSFGAYVLEDSTISDDFQVRGIGAQSIDSATAAAKPRLAPPNVRFTPRAIFIGEGTKADSHFPPLIAYLEVVDIEKSKPIPPTPLPPPDLLKRTFFFEKENQDKLDGNLHPENKQKALDDWVDKIQNDAPLLFRAIKSRYVMLRVTGYASPPGTYEYNSDISDARAQYVATRLVRTMGTESVRIDRRARGNRDAKEVPGVKPNQRDSVYLNDRRVEVVIDANEAKAGIERVMKESGAKTGP